jgi:hypothetical protein
MIGSLLGRGTGVTFGERMRGWFAFGEYECRAGAARGRRERTRLDLHACVEFADITGLLRKPDSAGALFGVIAFDATACVQRGSGKVQLFVPASDPQYALMIYEVAVQYNGGDHYLAGKKLIRRRRPLAVWTDTSTLFVQLHRGAGTGGPVVGAGIIHLSPLGLLRLLASLEAIERGTARPNRDACLTFLAFFLKQLIGICFGRERSGGRV